MDKNLVRKSVLHKRRELSALEKSKAELVMRESLFKWEVFKKAGVIHIFISKPDEPDTKPIIEHCLSSGKKIAVPLVLPNTYELFHSEIKSFDDLVSGIHGIKEPCPKKWIKINPESFDLVIVPGVAFDRQGGRLGHGKGYYDRFLEHSCSFLLALAFDCQFLESVPTEFHDVPMNAILSESGIIETKMYEDPVN